MNNSIKIVIFCACFDCVCALRLTFFGCFLLILGCFGSPMSGPFGTIFCKQVMFEKMMKKSVLKRDFSKRFRGPWVP